MTGYWTKSFDVGGTTRTAKVYISPETPIRSYYTVIAVPDGVDTAEFLVRSGWVDVADRREEGLFVLEPGLDGWGGTAAEAAYVEAAMSFYQSNRYFSIFGLHYLVGYGGGAPALEAWAVAHPLRVISQVYVDSPGLSAEYLNAYAAREFGGETDAGYTTVEFPEGFDLIRYDETVLPTWYIHPDQRSVGASLSYWKRANDTGHRRGADGTLGTVFPQRRGSDRWMTSYAGPISQVAVQDRPIGAYSRTGTRQIVDFLTSYTRYENFFAYGNQLFERADYAKLGVEVRTMTVEGFVREYLVYVPRSARRLWRDRAPVVFVWPGNSQTDKVFFDATQWWKVAEREGFILVTVCEQYSNTSVSVSHRDSNTFYRQLRDVDDRGVRGRPDAVLLDRAIRRQRGDPELRDRVSGVLRRGRLDLVHRRPECRRHGRHRRRPVPRERRDDSQLPRLRVRRPRVPRGDPLGRHPELARQLGAVPPPGQRPGTVRCRRHRR